jgi:hypothetical protein
MAKPIYKKSRRDGNVERLNFIQRVEVPNEIRQRVSQAGDKVVWGDLGTEVSQTAKVCTDEQVLQSELRLQGV